MMNKSKPVIKVISLLVIILFLSIGIGKSIAQGKTSRQPNIIIINMDDMGYGDTEPYGMTGIPTPNFNRLAKQGMRFTNFNVAQAVCSASRAALLTGCYPNRLGFKGALAPDAKIALNPKEETLASLLKKKGYKTAIYGKWHLGSRPPFFPVTYGFDDFFGVPYSHDMWPVDYTGKPITDPNNSIGHYPPLPLIDGEKTVSIQATLADQARLTTLFTQKAVSFIQANKKSPFFLYLAHPLPHVPLAASAKFKGKSEAGIFGDVIMELDWSVGEIMNALDKQGLSENTLLIVTSDNGPWLNFGNNAGSAGGFREGKGTTFEGGTRVPCYMRWPGKIEAGGVSSQLLTNMDVLPTIVQITGAAMPTNKIDGLSFWPLLSGKTTTGPREVFYYYYDANNLRGVRYKNWKLVLPHPSRSYAVNTPGKDGFPGKYGNNQVKLALYNLTHDPGEDYDVQALYPEIVAKIMQLAEAAREDLGDDLTNRSGKNRREPAIVP